MRYILMRRNDPVTMVEIGEDGSMIRFSKDMMNPHLAPLQDKTRRDWLKRWWDKRAVPVRQGDVGAYLKAHGFLMAGQYLTENLGLSLTDYYWIKPIESALAWKDVNLFKNDFHENLLASYARRHIGETAAGSEEIAAALKGFEKKETRTFLHDPPNGESVSSANTSLNEKFSFSPNASLQGDLEKTWMIRDGKRILAKGNRNHLSSESINEVIASKLHELQGYDNFVSYSLVRIKGKDYDYGCCCEAFTDLKKELIPASAVISSEPKAADVSGYEHFIRVCGHHGMDTSRLRADLEYQIMTDFILSGVDRNPDNIAILREADTLRFSRMAPIYDSGRCLFADVGVPTDDKELLAIQTNSFARTETALLEFVTDRSLVDVTKLPPPEFIRKMYQMDSRMDPGRIEQICEAYARKIELFRMFQLGRRPDIL